MNKIISLFAFIFLLSLVSADRLSFEVRDGVELLPTNDPHTIDVQITEDGEVIVENTQPDVVLVDSEKVEEGEITSVVLPPEDDTVNGEEEKNFKTEDSDDIDESDVPVLARENEEYNFEPTSVVLPSEEEEIDGEEEKNFKTEDSDDVDTSEVPVLELENENGGDTNPDDSAEATSVVLPSEGNTIDGEEEENFKSEDSDDVNDGDVPVLVLENEEYNFEATSAVLVYEGDEIDGEEEKNIKTEESDDVNDGDVPVLARENEEYNFEPTSVILPPEEEEIDGEEEEDFKTEDSDDVDTSEVPVLELENENGGDNNQDDSAEATSVVLPPEENTIDGEEEEDFKTEDSDDVNDGDVPVLTLENEEYNFEATSVVLVYEGEEIDKEENNLKTEDSDDVDTSEVPVLELENENGGETNPDDSTEVTSVVLPPEENPIDGEEEQNFKTEDSDDVDDADVPVLTLENEEYSFGPTSVVLPPEDSTFDGEEENTNEEGDVKPDQPVPTAEVKEDGFLP